ncbi:hypothetical protein KBTX_00457 [wastewater metagenome]|uniref:Cytochrome c-type biogenesis protein H Ig-like domain-containing protein n=4 Tax=root TaxID=1 RepID=A0A5B8R9I0_9ZZZZ|nr:c-type cytochrome biogenesis protein CcmI [Arhodomonas aquaeolei]MCS4504234.1 c-type cytochrome biogenesis protein CcmI [Arhodomonas aquaeolei]QEA04154.1 hypothetical protein KBTEX_00457 [uncultured organism]
MTPVIYTLVLLAGALAGVAFVVVPLLRRRRAEAVSERQALLSAHRERFVELDAEREAGNLSEDEYREAYEELERQLLEGVSGPAEQGSGGGRWMSVAAGLAVPVVALGVYLVVGSPQTVLPTTGTQAERIAQSGSLEEQRKFIRDNLGELQQRFEDDPGDVESGRMLARAYLAVDRPADAARVLARLMETAGRQPDLLVDRARALAMANGETGLTGEPRKLLEQALKQAPAHPDALWFAGLAAVQAGEAGRARSLWQRLLSELPPGSDSAKRLTAAIERLGGGSAGGDAAASSGAGVTVRIRVADDLAADLPAGTTVFVYARSPEGPEIPLAARRLTLGDLPAEVRLDSSMAMAGRSMAEGDRVELIARVSRSGRPMASAGDLQGSAGPVPVSGEDGGDPVAVVIDRRVEGGDAAGG